jgi:hypothetical protein
MGLPTPPRSTSLAQRLRAWRGSTINLEDIIMLTKFNALAFTVFTITMLALSYGFFSEVDNYDKIGYGLHPYLGMPLGILCFVVLWPTFQWLAHEE